VFHGMRAAMQHVFGTDEMKGRTIALQGVGQVGFYLIGHLLGASAKVVVTDIDEEKLKRARSQYEDIAIVPPEEIYDVASDVFAPCALGGTVNENTVPRLRAKIIAGSANNVLLDEDKDMSRLNERGITYVPDYVISAGGLINVANELEGYNRKQALAQAVSIFTIVEHLLKIAESEKISTLSAANAIAERRISSIAALKRTSLGRPLRPRRRL
ncbi:MAG TPA: Glu/Leu/Phe/Val dehydrogenase family protein, partial [Myxococcota bacterium]|nr:Glu/Leu/Phe/Val dehydrogenase family protein [Myxococcota bacterium]